MLFVQCLGQIFQSVRSGQVGIGFLHSTGKCLREVYPTVPPKVEYRLTEIGCSLVPLITQLTEWAQTNMKTIVSRAFCESLCRPELLAAYNLGGEHQPTGSVCDYLTGRTWFYAHWKQDPTIQSMLRMIGGTPSEHATPTLLVDGLEPLFADCNEADFQTYWERLTGGSAPIGFYYLPLREFGLADNLYIKMNARGKQLTPFEHFKADLIDHIHHQAQQHSEHSAWSALLDPQTGLPLKIDTSWTDLFWSTTHQVQPADRPEGRVDEIYFAFVNRYLLHSAIIRANATEQSPAWLLYPEGGATTPP